MTKEEMEKINQNLEIHDGNLKRVYNRQTEILEKIESLKNEVESFRFNMEIMILNIDHLVMELT